MTINTNRKHVIYIFSIIVFIVYLLNANMLLALTSGTPIKEVEFKKFNKQNPVFWNISEVAVYNNLKESFSIRGWAFCETETSNEQKKISIVLKSKDIAYEYPTIISNRLDILRVFKGKRKVRGIMNGYAGEFSTIPIKNGIYELYLYCWENEENFGLVNTGQMFEKDEEVFREYLWTSEIVDISKDDLLKEEIESRLDNSQILNDGSVSIDGWAFVEGIETDNQKVYVEVTDTKGKTAIYNTKTLTRFDISESYESDMYSQSGFKATIKEGELEQGELIITIYIENEGHFYEAKKYLKDENGIHEYIWATQQTNINKDNLLKEGVEGELNNLQPLDDYSISINGWTFIDGFETSNQKVYVELKDASGKTVTYDTKSLARNDVGKAFENDMYNQSGFETIIRKNELEQGELIITVYIENEGHFYEAKKYLKDEKGIQEYIWSTQRNDINKQKLSEEAVEGELDSVQKLDDGSIIINGWTFADGLDTSNQKVYLEVIDSSGKIVTYDTKSLTRDDVGEAYKSNMYNQSGFEEL